MSGLRIAVVDDSMAPVEWSRQYQPGRDQHRGAARRCATGRPSGNSVNAFYASISAIEMGTLNGNRL